MTDITQVAALIAAGLVNNGRYLKCVREGNYSALDGLGERAEYALDVDSIAKDAWAVALKIEGAERDRNRNTSHALRERADRVRVAFANYVDGTGRDAHEIAAALPAILDELEHLRGLERLRLRELETETP